MTNKKIIEEFEEQLKGSIRTAWLNGGNIKVLRETESMLVGFFLKALSNQKQEFKNELLKVKLKVFNKEGLMAINKLLEKL